MNARQKAKKYKKELEMLKNYPVRYQIVENRLDVRTLMVNTQVPIDMVRSEVGLDTIDDWYYKQLLDQIASSDEFKQAARFSKEVFPNRIYPNPVLVKYTARVDVVVR